MAAPNDSLLASFGPSPHPGTTQWVEQFADMEKWPVVRITPYDNDNPLQVLSDVRTKTKFLLGEGEYRGCFKIGGVAPFAIVGEGDSIISLPSSVLSAISSSSQLMQRRPTLPTPVTGPCLTVTGRTCGVYMTQIHIKNEHETVPAMVVEHGARIEISKCSIRSPTIGLTIASPYVHVNQTLIGQCAVGIRVAASCKNRGVVNIGRCRFVGNDVGIQTEDESATHVANCNVQESIQVGFLSSGDSVTKYESCTVSASKMHGVCVEGRAKAILSNTTVTENHGYGVLCGADGRLNMQNCDITENVGRQVMVTGTASCFVHDSRLMCTSSAEKSVAIGFSGSSDGVVEGCTIRNFALCGIAVSNTATPILQQNNFVGRIASHANLNEAAAAETDDTANRCAVMLGQLQEATLKDNEVQGGLTLVTTVPASEITESCPEGMHEPTPCSAPEPTTKLVVKEWITALAVESEEDRAAAAKGGGMQVGARCSPPPASAAHSAIPMGSAEAALSYTEELITQKKVAEEESARLKAANQQKDLQLQELRRELRKVRGELRARSETPEESGPPPAKKPPTPQPPSRPHSARVRSSTSCSNASRHARTPRPPSANLDPAMQQHGKVIGHHLWRTDLMGAFLRLEVPLHQVRMQCDTPSADAADVPARLHDEWLTKKHEKSAALRQAYKHPPCGKSRKLSLRQQQAHVSSVYYESLEHLGTTTQRLKDQYLTAPPPKRGVLQKHNQETLSEMNKRIYYEHQKHRKEVHEALWQRYVVPRPKVVKPRTASEAYCASLHKSHRDKDALAKAVELDPEAEELQTLLLHRRDEASPTVLSPKRQKSPKKEASPSPDEGRAVSISTDAINSQQDGVSVGKTNAGTESIAWGGTDGGESEPPVPVAIADIEPAPPSI